MLFRETWFNLLLQEVTKTRNDMIQMESAVAERLGYLQRHKVAVVMDGRHITAPPPKNNRNNENSVKEYHYHWRLIKLSLLFQDMATFKIAALQKNLDQSVPVKDLDNLTKKYTDMTEKYRDILERSNSLVVSNEQSAGFEV